MSLVKQSQRTNHQSQLDEISLIGDLKCPIGDLKYPIGDLKYPIGDIMCNWVFTSVSPLFDEVDIYIFLISFHPTFTYSVLQKELG